MFGPTTKNWFAFLFGLGAVTQIRIIGAMGITEAFCIVLGPFVFFNIWPKMRETKAKTIMTFLFFWFISAVFTDLIRESSLNDALRGIFAIPILFLVFVVAFALLWDDLTRVRWMALGVALSAIVSMYVFRAQVTIGLADYAGQSVEDVMTFKTYYAAIVFVNISAFTVFLYRKWPAFVIVLLIFSGVFYLSEGSRSVFLVLFISAIGAWLAFGQYYTLRKVQTNTVLLTVVVALGGWMAMEIYVYSVENGWMGEDEYAKYEMQTDSDIGLMEGRVEFIGALFAIKDSPFIGYGSWAIDRGNYGTQMLEYIDDRDAADIRDRKSMERDLYMPAHSHVWQAWIWHGFLGGFFWLSIFFLMISFLKKAIHLCRPLIAYNLLLLFSSLWDLFFSAFSNRPRWGIVFAIVAISLAEVERRRRTAPEGTIPDMESPWDGRWGAQMNSSSLKINEKRGPT
jgi:hypothetical protein